VGASVQPRRRRRSHVRAASSSERLVTWETYRVVVEHATHDDLKDGRTATGVSLVEVVAQSQDEAFLIAAQMVAARGRMPTRTTPA
jgi:hypothetical protein